MTNSQTVLDTLNKFMETYETDMRGDKSTSADASSGLVGEIREIKKYVRDYPSITWLFAHKPIATTGTIIGVFILLMGLYTAGMVQLLASLAGVTIP